MSQNEQNGSEQPTPYKLEQARKQGQVPKSVEVTSIAVLGMFLAVITLFGANLVASIERLSAGLLANSAQWTYAPAGVAEGLRQHFEAALLALLPTFAALMGIAVLATIVQVGPVFALEVLKPKWERLNPAQGLKRLFSKKSLIEAMKSSAKLAFVAIAIYLFVSAAIPKLVTAGNDNGSAVYAYAIDELGPFAFKIFVLLVVFAVIDALIVRRDFTSRMMMTRRDLRDEHKNREGDPRIKARIRELRQEMLKRTQSLRKVPDADVLLTNPTRIVVALKYDRDADLAPRIIAKGAGELAKRMRAVASKHGIPIVRQPTIARELFYASRIDEFIPPSLFPQIAKILAWAFLARQRAAVEQSR